MKTLDKRIDRRLFLKALGIMGIGLTANPVLANPLNTIKFSKDMYMVKKTKALMGTFVTITLLDPSKEKAEAGIEEAFHEITRVSEILNRYTDSPVFELNRRGFLRDVSPEIRYVLDASLHYHSISHGAFDITVKPVMDIYQGSFIKNHKPPEKERLHEALKLIDSNNIHLDSQGVRFQRDDMGITFDGIAKGYVVDKGIEHLQKTGIKHALINAGGDIRAIGGKRDRTPWKIALRDPFKDKDYKTIIPLYSQAVATSGSYEIFFDKERLFHHIINPSTGFSPRESSSVSVVSKSAMDADALATTLFVLGPERGMELTRKLKDTESLFIDSKDRVTESSGWKQI